MPTVNTELCLEPKQLGFRHYARSRAQTRQDMIALRQQRSIALTDNIRLTFENHDTVRYQIQEVMYAARSSCEQEINAQIKAYQHLLPTGKNLTATLMLEYPQPQQAVSMVQYLSGIQDTVFLQLANGKRIWPATNQDIGGLPLVGPVHYLTWQLNAEDIALFAKQANLAIGIAHHRCQLNGHAANKSMLRSLGSDLKVLHP